MQVELTKNDCATLKRVIKMAIEEYNRYESIDCRLGSYEPGKYDKKIAELKKIKSKL